jgi:hypothetical protein
MKSLLRLLLLVVVSQALPLAWAGQVQGDFLPEKQKYLVGEPVFVQLHVKNEGSQPIWISVSCVWLDTRFEIPAAPKPPSRPSLFGCALGGTAGSCAGSSKEIRPGEEYTRRYLLDGPFRLDPPGVYAIRAWHKVDIYPDETSYRNVASQEVTSEFELTFIEGSDNELASVYAPILRDLKSPDSLTNWLARCAIVQNPPRFLESVILDMADDPQTAGYSVAGLERLGTPRAKAKLAKVSEAGDPEAIQALAGFGDPAYCGTMLDIARESHEYSRFIALRAAGYLCGEKVLPLATAELASADPSPRFEAAYALGNSHTREAVPPLISLLLDPDESVRRAARDSLATLTHRRSKSDRGPAQDVFRDWNNWWRSSGATVPIYGIDECKDAEPLP